MHLRPPWNLDAHQLLDGQSIAQVVAHGRDIIHAIGVGGEILVTDRLALLLEAGVEITDVGIRRHDRLAVQFHDHAQDAMGGWVLRPHVEDHVLVGVGLLRRHGRHRFGFQDLFAERLEFLVLPGHRERHWLAAARHVLAQRIVGPVQRHQDAAQIGMAVEFDAHEVVDLALEPIGASPQAGERGQRGIIAAGRRHFERQPLAAGRGKQMIDAGEAFLAVVGRILAPIHSGEIRQVIEAQLGIIAQKLRHPDQILRSDDQRHLVAKLALRGDGIGVFCTQLFDRGTCLSHILYLTKDQRRRTKTDELWSLVFGHSSVRSIAELLTLDFLL